MTDFRDAPPQELPRGIALAWGIAAHPQRGPKREMSVERIVDAAVALADARGLGAVSMAAVAKELGYTTMSLYRYVSAKDDLLLLMQEEVLGLPPVWDRADEQAGEEGWRLRLQQLYLALVQELLRHPWVLELPAHMPPTTPHRAAWLEAGLEALHQTGLPLQHRLATWYAVVGHAHWHGQRAVQVQSVTPVDDIPEPRAAEALGVLQAVLDPDLYPRLRQVLDAGLFAAPTEPVDFGVQRLFDGLAQWAAVTTPDEPTDTVPPIMDSVAAEALQDKRFKAAQKAVREAQKGLTQAKKALGQAQRAQDQALQEAVQRGKKKRG